MGAHLDESRSGQLSQLRPQTWEHSVKIGKASSSLTTDTRQNVAETKTTAQLSPAYTTSLQNVEIHKSCSFESFRVGALVHT